MNRLLLLFAAVLIATAANAQMKRSESPQTPSRPTLLLMNSKAKVEANQMRTPGTPVVKAPERAQNVNVWYRRPAGAFPSSLAVADGSYAGFLFAPYLSVKPYSEYTFLGFAEGVSDNAQYYWDVQYWDKTGPDGPVQTWTTVEGKNLTWKWGNEVDEVPTFNVIDNDEYYSWYLHGLEMTSIHPAAYEEHKAHLLSVPGSIEELWGYDLLKSSKTFNFSGDPDGGATPMIFYSDAEPYGQNEKGYWFGKNGGYTSVIGPTYHIDGIAQAFEKPEHAYVLKQVVMDCGVLDVAGPVDLWCKIYKLDEIPAYMDDDYVRLPEEPGEFIAHGRASLSPSTNETSGGMVFFTLYDEDDYDCTLEFEITPTIDCAILVVIEGYNDPEMENLTNFSAMIASNFNDDEGFGELAYLKLGVPDDEGNVDHYEWAGLNNFFSSGTMKTGFTIFLSTELPYLTFYYPYEDGEYTFPIEGGVIPPIGDHCIGGIKFWSWVPSHDEEWTLSCNGGEIPDWLTIELEDELKEGEFSGVVNAMVTAEPLPEGVRYREAVVRFEFTGAYIDYKFMQGYDVGPNPPPYLLDYNGDNETNIADINTLIDLIIKTGGEYGMGPLNWLIGVILGYNQPEF